MEVQTLRGAIDCLVEETRSLLVRARVVGMIDPRIGCDPIPARGLNGISLMDIRPLVVIEDLETIELSMAKRSAARARHLRKQWVELYSTMLIAVRPVLGQEEDFGVASMVLLDPTPAD